MPALDVDAHAIAKGIVASVGCEARLATGAPARGEPVSSIKESAFAVKHDWLEQSARGDVLGEHGEFRLGHGRKDRCYWMWLGVDGPWFVRREVGLAQ